MGKFYILTQILQGNALFTGKIYTARKFFTRPPVATVVTNFKSGQSVTLKRSQCVYGAMCFAFSPTALGAILTMIW